MSNNKNILFYLSSCNTCQGFIKMCQENRILQKFELVCIDNNIKFYVSKGVEVVPTIVIAGYQRPIAGKDCFSWLNSVVQMNNVQKPMFQYGSEKDTQNINRQKEDIFAVKPPPPPPVINKNVEPQKKELLGFREAEMNSISDSYAYKDVDSAFPMNFQHKNSNFEIYTGIEGKKINKTEQERLIREFQSERTNEQNEFARLTEQKIKELL